MWFTMNMGGCLGVVHCEKGVCLGVVHCEKGVCVWVWFTMNIGCVCVCVVHHEHGGVFGCGSL